MNFQISRNTNGDARKTPTTSASLKSTMKPSCGDSMTSSPRAERRRLGPGAHQRARQQREEVGAERVGDDGAGEERDRRVAQAGAQLVEVREKRHAPLARFRLLLASVAGARLGHQAFLSMGFADGIGAFADGIGGGAAVPDGAAG